MHKIHRPCGEIKRLICLDHAFAPSLTFFVRLQEKLRDFPVGREHLNVFAKREAFHGDAKQPHHLGYWLCTQRWHIDITTSPSNIALGCSSKEKHMRQGESRLADSQPLHMTKNKSV